MSGKYNFKIEQGATYSRSISHKDVENNLIDYTGYDAVMTMRYDNKDGELALELSTGNGITITSEKISLTILPTQTSLLQDRPCFYNFKLINKENITDVKRLLEGNISIITDVTPNEEVTE